MDQGMVLDIIREGLFTVISVAMWPLVIGLSAGLVMSIFQTVTSIQEPTLAFIPKILAVLLALVLAGPLMLNNLVGFFRFVLETFATFAQGGAT